MSLRRALFGSATSILLLVGAGCGYFAGTVSEVQYYNDLITQTNVLNSQIDSMRDTLARAKDSSNEGKAISYSSLKLDGSMADGARSNTIDREQLVNMDEGARAEVDELAGRFFDLTNAAGGVHAQLADYSESEGYKDDNGKQFKKLEEELQASLDQLEPVQQELSDLIKEKQDGIDLGIDESSTDPIDVATLTTDTLSTDAEEAQNAALAWLDVYVESGTSGSTDDMQAALDKLSADYDTYKQRSDDANVSDLSHSGSRFDSYMEAINDYMNEYEATIRRINNGELEGIEVNIGGESLVVDGLAYIYNDKIVGNHNAVVSSLQFDARSGY